MERYFTKTFFKFFAAFMLIISAAFGVLIYSSSQIQDVDPRVNVANTN